MNRGSLIALGLTVGTLALLYSQRKASGKDASVPAGGYPEPGGTQRPPPGQGGQPGGLIVLPGGQVAVPIPPYVTPFPAGIFNLPGGQIAVPLTDEQKRLLAEYDRVFAAAQRDPTNANPYAMGRLADELAAANLMTEQANLRELARGIAAARAAAQRGAPPPGGPPLGGVLTCSDGAPPGPDGTCFRYKR